MSSWTVRPRTRFTYGSSTWLKKKALLGRHRGSVTLELTTTRRFTPCRCMAAMMCPVPVEYTSTGRRVSGPPRAESTAWLPATAASTASGSVTSARAMVRPARGDSFSGRRVTAVTSCPAVRAWPVSCLPVGPVAPKTVMRMCRAPSVQG